MAKKKKETAAQRARRKRDAAVQDPPPAIKGVQSSILELELVVAGVRYPIGRNVEGDTPWSMAMGETATVTIPIRSPDRSLEAVLGDESLLQETGITLEVDDVVYVVQSVETDETGLYTLTLEDQVSWRLRQFNKFMAASRKTTTRAGFVLRMIHEASNPPLAPIETFIPEVRDRQSIAQPERT